MKKVDYNIEFGHIFVNEKFCSRQRESSKIAKKFIEQLNKKKKTYSTTILIDDYQPSYSYLDICSFLESVKNLGIAPGYIVYESQLHSLANKLLSLINKKNIIEEKVEIKVKSNKDTLLLNHRNMSSLSLKDEYFAKRNDYIETPVLIAAWYLLRLGILQKQGIVKETKYTKKVPFVGENLLTIIPKQYKPIDTAAKKILECTKYKNCLKRMTETYF